LEINWQVFNPYLFFCSKINLFFIIKQQQIKKLLNEGGGADKDIFLSYLKKKEEIVPSHFII